MRQFKAPDGRSYLLTKDGEVEKINDEPVSNSDRKHLTSLGFAVFTPNKNKKEVKNAD